jgi:hypothetical protein
MVVELVTILAPLVLSPLVTWFVKWLDSKTVGAPIGPKTTVAVSSTAGALISLAAGAATGNVASIATGAAALAQGAISGAGGSKLRDILTGKPSSCGPKGGAGR